MTKRLVLVMLMSCAIAGCQGKNSQERKQAPTGAKDVGVLVETSDPHLIALILKAYPNAQVRNLSPKHGLYEIFGVTNDEIARLAPEARLTSNEFITFKPLSVPGPKGLKVDGLNPCKAADKFPTSVVKITLPADAPATFSLELGQKVKLTAENSKAHLLFPSTLKTAFVVVRPDASQVEGGVTVQKEVEITPDALGAYHVFLVVQDSRDVCALDAVHFIATSNRPFQNVSESGRVDLSLLSHLKAVNAQESWAKSQGEGIVIAIIDTGVNYNHQLLSANIEHNARETAGNNTDNDGNGFANDELGYDFINSDPFPYDDDGHGTHVAGLAAARQIGMAQKARILAVKAMTSIGGDAGSIAAAVVYAVDRGAKIINMSLGTTGPAPHPLIVRAIEYAENKGVLIVVASGNGDPKTGLGFSIDANPVYPASLPNRNILTVAASDSLNSLTPYSNFGKVGVDITAPGGFGRDPMISTAFENPGGALFVGMTGTSMASPVVAGIAAQLWSLNPSLTALQVKELLMKSGPEDAALVPITVSGRHLNALSAVESVRVSNVLF